MSKKSENQETLDEDDQNDDEADMDNGGKEECFQNNKFHFLMSCRINVRGKKLPDQIVLKNPVPGESYVMQTRPKGLLDPTEQMLMICVCF